jgi:hypothetical protein
MADQRSETKNDDDEPCPVVPICSAPLVPFCSATHKLVSYSHPTVHGWVAETWIHGPNADNVSTPLLCNDESEAVLDFQKISPAFRITCAAEFPNGPVVDATITGRAGDRFLLHTLLGPFLYVDAPGVNGSNHAFGDMVLTARTEITSLK